MDEALAFPGGGRQRAIIAPLALAASSLVLLGVAAWLHASMGLLVVGIAVLGAILFASVPLPMAIGLFFGYLFGDGAIKILSDYHPVFHVAQDLVVIALVLRSVCERGNGGVEKFFRTPYSSLILVFAFWILVQYVNPFGLGAMPSLAGTKVYVSGILLYAVAYHHLRRGDGEKLLTWFVALGLAEGALATLEYLFWQGAVFRLHPRYAEIAGASFTGDLFRPFGTTSAPGAPSMWIFLTIGPAVYLIAFARALPKKLLGTLHLAAAVPTLFFCQTRSAILLSALGALLPLLCPGLGLIRRLAIATVTGALVVGAATLIPLNFLLPEYGGEGALKVQQVNVLRERLATLGEQNTFASSRGGAWDGIAQLAESTIFGIGLSRVGAASAVWGDRIAADPYFGKKWSFADNLYRAIFTELGLFGLIGWLFVVLAPAIGLLRAAVAGKDSATVPLLWLCGTYPLLVLIGGIGSEGVLYNPISGFLWIMLGIGTREAHEPARA